MKICVWFIHLPSWKAFRRLERWRGDRGQAFVETMLTTAFLVAIVMNELFGPVVIEAFEKISEKLASVGP